MQLYNLKKGESRSISAENFDGQKNAGALATEGTNKRAAKHLGQGWKVSPSVLIKPGENFTLANIPQGGIINHIWITCDIKKSGNLILNMFWDGEQTPSVDTPLADFFCCGFFEPTLVNSAYISVNPKNGMNSYFQMPFRESALITLKNQGEKNVIVYYQIDYTLCEPDADAAYFHAAFRKEAPLETPGIFTINDSIVGNGQYVGTYLAYKVNNRRWWGEGEVKFYIDGDQYPTICTTGTEDYFGGAWNFEYPRGEYGSFSSLYLGMLQARWRKRPFAWMRYLDKFFGINGLYKKGARFNLYRWHAYDAIRFRQDLKVTIQDLGWKLDFTYLQQRSDIRATSYWYQLKE
ncbi:MAG: glycoside hydrolase family 172 protein [Clostridia bacterium]